MLNTDAENAEIRLSLLQPPGRSQSYKYPTGPIIQLLSLSHILTKVSPNTRIGRTYTLTQNEKKIATDKCLAIKS